MSTSLLLPAAAPAAMQDQAAAAADAANPVVGGAEMLPTRTIVENASASSDHSTLVAAIKAAGLEQTLSGPGPFTVLAPSNEAFGRLAPGTMDALLKPENKETLVKVLTYHVIPGEFSFEQLMAKAHETGAAAQLTTVEGEPLTLSMEGEALKISDVNGNASYIAQPDVKQSNGVIHVVNGVLLPKLN
ncbi:MAG: hypothetical protein ABS87_08980 [Sphingomonas sp. SCN 67-18]|uniref:fasciclin domain-containing protein n=1 Tax=uncultured Sphingomonas sp. TaxID=158754 RepID=UPI00086F6AED|nr:fasciclin domain-containing protein [Sphingomonas sp. SCN 67-18]ODU20819.1 MAG: hypothetical protein ABS87_08980 [Sphingomonas sp. SCN 67-18]